MSESKVVPAHGHELDIESRYTTHFGNFLVRHLPIFHTPVYGLELLFGTGSTSMAIAQSLPQGSRLTAVSNDRSALVSLHEKLVLQSTIDSTRVEQVVFPHKDDPTKLPFAIASTDFAVLVLPTGPLLGDTTNIRTVLRQLLRFLKPNAPLLVCVPLPGSFKELFTAITSFDAAGETVRHVLAARGELTEAYTWHNLIQQAGALSTTMHEHVFTFETTSPISDDPLVSAHILPLWYGTNLSSTEARVLNAAIRDPIRVSVRMGCLVGHKAV